LRSVISTMWYMGFEVFVEVKVPIVVVWVITPCCLIGTKTHTRWIRVSQRQSDAEKVITTQIYTIFTV